MSQSVPEEQRRQIDALYAAFNRREVDTVLDQLTDDVVWENGWEGGYVQGRDGVRDYWRRQFEQISPTVTPRAFEVASDGRVRVYVDQVVRTSDGALVGENEVVHVFRFDGDRIARFDIGTELQT